MDKEINIFSKRQEELYPRLKELQDRIFKRKNNIYYLRALGKDDIIIEISFTDPLELLRFKEEFWYYQRHQLPPRLQRIQYRDDKILYGVKK